MPAPLDLPDGYAQRPLTITDAALVTGVIAAQELNDIGAVEIEESDILADWQRPSHDLAASSVGVFADQALIGYVELVGADRYDAAVHPEHRGRGIGTALAHWIQQLGRERGAAVVGMPVPEGSAGDRLLEALGYRVRWNSWVLELPHGAEVPHRPLPPAYVVREATAADHRAAYALQEDAFLEWSVRERDSYDDWASHVVLRPGFEPWNLRVVTDPGGDVVAMALVLLGGEPPEVRAYIDRLATRPDRRGRGLAQALLVDAFAVAHEHGAVASSLSTDSRTGALGLYERVGMVVTSTWVNRAVNL